MSSSLSRDTPLGGRYEIERELGRGGTASVYLAREPRHERQVAVKVLSPSVTEELGLDRFLAEIRTTAQLSHPHILPLIDSGHERGAPYYVMPFAEGGSLRDLIRRDGPLPLDRALGIASAVATALAHAHAKGVTHRDVKPGNILLDAEGNPYLADFGIARVPRDPDDTQRTDTGQAIGTPRYMSPEQIDGDRKLTRASDVYSLAFVIYEMLDGAPPFPARNPAAQVAAQLRSKLPRSRRIPSDVRKLLQRALSHVPAERPSAAELAESLETMRSRRRVPRTLRYVAAAAALVALVGYGVRVASGFEDGVVLDTTRYAVLPFEGGDAWAGPVPLDVLVAEALGQWEGIATADPLRVAEVFGSGSVDGPPELAEIRQAGRLLVAGRVVTGIARRVGDSLRVEASLRDANSGSETIERVAFSLGRDARQGEAAVAEAVEMLLFGPTSRAGTLLQQSNSVPAVRQFIQGERARGTWDLIRAEAHFAMASEHDSNFDLAALWRAQVSSWMLRATREWEADARRAAESTRLFDNRDRALAHALAAMADGRHPEACADYERLLASGLDDFSALFGLGECRRRDESVIRAPGTRTGWTFRGSGHAAATAFRQAFERLPASYRTFGASDSDFAQRLLYATGSLRPGRGPPPQSRTFVGFPEWRGDSLAFLVVPNDSLLSVSQDSEAAAEALARQRRVLLDVAHAWVRAYPNSASAVNTLAVARELVGEASALATYGEARSLATDPALGAAIGASEVVLRVRLSLPNDQGELRIAVALGDSLLTSEWDVPQGTQQRLADLAVLLGRPTLAASLRRAGATGDGLSNTALEVIREGQALLAFASVGAPVDSIAALEDRTERLISEIAPSPEQREVRQSVLEQPAFMAFPNYSLAFTHEVGLPRGREARAIAAVVGGDVENARAYLGDPLGEAGWDVVFARANVLVAAGEGQLALRVLQHHFAGLSAADPREVAGMARLGGLARATMLRAELEQRYGSRMRAVEWARAGEILWSTSEDGLAERLAEIRSLADSPERP